VPAPRVLGRADGAALLTLLPGRPAGEHAPAELEHIRRALDEG